MTLLQFNPVTVILLRSQKIGFTPLYYEAPAKVLLFLALKTLLIQTDSRFSRAQITNIGKSNLSTFVTLTQLSASTNDSEKNVLIRFNKEKKALKKCPKIMYQISIDVILLTQAHLFCFCFPKNENHNPMPFVLSVFFPPFSFFSEEGAFPGIRKWKADVWGPSLRAPLLQNKMGEKEEDKREGGSSCFV